MEELEPHWEDQEKRADTTLSNIITRKVIGITIKERQENPNPCPQGSVDWDDRPKAAQNVDYPSILSQPHNEGVKVMIKLVLRG